MSVVYEAEEPRLLRPGPVLRAANRIAWAGTLVAVAGAVAIWIGNLLGAGAVLPALIAGLICFAYALALYGWAGARRATLTTVARGMPRAMAIWRAAWYCDECDGVFFAQGDGPLASVIASGMAEAGAVRGGAAEGSAAEGGAVGGSAVKGSAREAGAVEGGAVKSGVTGGAVISPAAFHRLLWRVGGFPGWLAG